MGTVGELRPEEIIMEEECGFVQVEGDFWLFFASGNNVYKAVLLALMGVPYFGIKDIDTRKDWKMQVDLEMLISNGMVSECA